MPQILHEAVYFLTGGIWVLLMSPRTHAEAVMATFIADCEPSMHVSAIDRQRKKSL